MFLICSIQNRMEHLKTCTTYSLFLSSDKNYKIITSENSFLSYLICINILNITLFLFAGSPFQYSVGQLSSGGYHKVQVGGPGVEKGEVKKESKSKLWFFFVFFLFCCLYNLYMKSPFIYAFYLIVIKNTKQGIVLAFKHITYEKC